jgi:hypothetical protein
MNTHILERGARLNDKDLQDVVGTILACAGSAVPSSG